MPSGGPCTLLFTTDLVGPSDPFLSVVSASQMECSWPALKVWDLMNPGLRLPWTSWPERENGGVGVRTRVRATPDPVTEGVLWRSVPWGLMRMDWCFLFRPPRAAGSGTSCLTHGKPSSSPVSVPPSGLPPKENSIWARVAKGTVGMLSASVDTSL